MRKTLSVLMVALMVVLSGCASTGITKAQPLAAPEVYAKALPGVRAKAELGDPMAMYTLGDWMSKGRGTGKPNPKDGIIWVKKAAAKNLMVALAALGNDYAIGSLGAEQDVAQGRLYASAALKVWSAADGLGFEPWEKRVLANTFNSLGTLNKINPEADYCQAIKIDPSSTEDAKNSLVQMGKKCE